MSSFENDVAILTEKQRYYARIEYLKNMYRTKIDGDLLESCIAILDKGLKVYDRSLNDTIKLCTEQAEELKRRYQNVLLQRIVSGIELELRKQYDDYIISSRKMITDIQTQLYNTTSVCEDVITKIAY